MVAVPKPRVDLLMLMMTWIPLQSHCYEHNEVHLKRVEMGINSFEVAKDLGKM